jgi:excisionase family DNA binding protein
MSALARALLDELDDQALDELARLLAPRLAAHAPAASASPYEDVDGAAAYIRAGGRQRIYDLVYAGALTPVRDGRRLLFRREDLDEYLAAGERAA